MVSRDLENKRRLRYRNCMTRVPKNMILRQSLYLPVWGPKTGHSEVNSHPLGQKWPCFLQNRRFCTKSCVFFENRWWEVFWPSKMTKIGPPNLGRIRQPWGPILDPLFLNFSCRFQSEMGPKNDQVWVEGLKNTILRQWSHKRSTTFGGLRKLVWAENDPKKQVKIKWNLLRNAYSFSESS